MKTLFYMMLIVGLLGFGAYQAFKHNLINVDAAKKGSVNKTNEFQQDAVLCTFGSDDEVKHFNGTEEKTAFAHCQSFLSRSSKKTQDTAFCFPEKSCP